jgi:hypothetical protein
MINDKLKPSTDPKDVQRERDKWINCEFSKMKDEKVDEDTNDKQD